MAAASPRLAQHRPLLADDTATHDDSEPVRGSMLGTLLALVSQPTASTLEGQNCGVTSESPPSLWRLQEPMGNELQPRPT